MPDQTPRYRVEPAIDGSWLVVDRGPDRAGRCAISRFEIEPDAHQDAETLSSLEDITTRLDPTPVGAEWGIEDLLADHEAAINAKYNFDHLLHSDPPA